jgi:hypothetical protein
MHVISIAPSEPDHVFGLNPAPPPGETPEIALSTARLHHHAILYLLKILAPQALKAPVAKVVLAPRSVSGHADHRLVHDHP